MNSLAVTDSLLLLVTIMIAAGAKYPPSLRLSAGIDAAQQKRRSVERRYLMREAPVCEILLSQLGRFL